MMGYEVHDGHGPWRQAGQCVYCSCGARLYQGKIPKDGDQLRIARALDAVDALAAAAAPAYLAKLKK